MKTETIVMHEDRNVTLTAYIQETGGEFGYDRRPAILVIPGGGYAMCSDREADPVALAYSKAGYQSFVLRYTVKGKGGWPHPLNDYEEAMEMIRQRSEEWHVEPEKTAVVGFSAGGHLAACGATVAEHKPAAAILVYPAILKEIVDLCQPGMPYPNEHVSRQTPPCFIAAARDDRAVNIRNELMMELALAENDVPFESHIYSYGGHGFSTAEENILTASAAPRVQNWVSDSIEWLGEVMGRFTRNGFTEPCMQISLNSNDLPVLSVMCTLAHMQKQGGDAKAVLAPMFAAIEALAKARGYETEALMEAVGTSTIRELLEILQIPEETILSMDAQLHGIVNKLEV